MAHGCRGDALLIRPVGLFIDRAPVVKLTNRRLGLLTVRRFVGWKMPTGIPLPTHAVPVGIRKAVDSKSWMRARAIWECKCQCGRIVYMTGYNLLHSRADPSQRSCGCQSNPRGSRHPNWRGCGGITGKHWHRIVACARTRDLPVTVTIGDIWQLWLQQRGCCALTGTQLQLDTDKRNPGNASLDRIDSSKGYVPGNVQWVLIDVNLMKQDIDEAHFIGLCAAVVQHRIIDAQQEGTDHVDQEASSEKHQAASAA